MAEGLPTLVMLPGTLCDGRIFQRQKRALRGLADVRLVDYKHLKLGQTWLTQLLKSLPEKFSVAGFSLGGIWALELLRQAPERVERLAMLASNAQADSPKGRRNSRHLNRLWAQPHAGSQAVLRRAMPAYFHHATTLRRHTELLHDMARRTPSQAALAQFARAGSRPEGLSVLTSFAGPLLIISGTKDRLCPPPWQQAMVQAQPTAHWLALPRIGHFLPLEAPCALNHALAQWLRLSRTVE